MSNKLSHGGAASGPTPRASAKPNLAALVDGAPLAEAEARDLWKDFSAHMDEHEGDMAGFAKAKGWQSVAPEYRKGQAVLVVKTGRPVEATLAKKRR